MIARGLVPPPPTGERAYFFDIDGTLAELAEAPARANVDPALRERIVALHALTGGAVALVTGRPIASVDPLFPGLRLPVAGQHGSERRRADGTVAYHPDAAGWIAEVQPVVERAVGGRPGVHIEAKGASIAIHYRAAPRSAAFVHRLARRVAAERGPGIAVLPGKRVVELVPADQTKGRAVLDYLAEAPFQGRLPVFVGDDVSDESAFHVVNALGGESVKVGPGPTEAFWRLNGVRAVRAWLESRP